MSRTDCPSLTLPDRICPASGILDELLDHALQRPRSVDRIVALVGQPRARGVIEFQRELTIDKQLLQPPDLDVDDGRHVLALETVEQDDLVDAVEEFRPELGAHLGHDVGPHGLGVLALLLVGQELGADVGRHDDQRVLEVDRAALAIGETPIVEHLQQDVEDVRMRLLDLVEQHDLVWPAAHGFGERTALLVADITRRSTDEPGDGVLFHVLAHVEAHHGRLVVEQERCQRLGQLGLADAGRAQEDERAERPVGVLQTGTRAPDGG